MTPHQLAMLQRARWLAKLDLDQPCYFCAAADAWRTR